MTKSTINRSNVEARAPQAHRTAGETTGADASAMPHVAAPHYKMPPLTKSRRTEVRVPASVNGRDLSQGEP